MQKLKKKKKKKIPSILLLPIDVTDATYFHWDEMKAIEMV